MKGEFKISLTCFIIILTRHMFLPLLYSFSYISNTPTMTIINTFKSWGGCMFRIFLMIFHRSSSRIENKNKEFKKRYFFTAAAAVELSASISNSFQIFCQYFFKYFSNIFSAAAELSASAAATKLCQLGRKI